MKKWALFLVLCCLCLSMGPRAFGRTGIEIYEPGYNYEIVARHLEEVNGEFHYDLPLIVDNDENVYFTKVKGVDDIWKMDKDGNVTLFAEVHDHVQRISFDHINGVMYCVGWDYVDAKAYMMKITGFTPRAETQDLQDLRAQVEELNSQINPALQIISPSDGATVSGIVNIDIFTDNEEGLTSCLLYVDNRYVRYDNSAPFGFSWDSSRYAGGSHTIKVMGYFGNGISVRKTATITVNVQHSPIVTPWIRITSPSSGDTVSGTVTITTDVADGFGTLYLLIDGRYRGYDGDEPFEFTYDTSALGNGTHYITVRGYHLTGQYVASKSIAVEVSN